jgi:hypothetical protein
MFGSGWFGLGKETSLVVGTVASSRAQRGILWHRKEWCGKAVCVEFRQVMETTYTVGVVAASMPQGGMC